MGGSNARSGRGPGIPFERASATSPVAASGLRPVPVFVFVAAVFALVAARSVYIQKVAHGQQPDALRMQESPTAGFSILDRAGRPLATSVECFDVTVSPQALWRSHTPRRMCAAIAEILDGAHVSRGPSETQSFGERDILERTMPLSLREGEFPGRVVPSAPKVLRFTEGDLEALRSWIDTGSIPSEILAGGTESLRGAFDARSGTRAIRGLSIVPVSLPATSSTDTAYWTLAIDPVECLSAQTRMEQLGKVKRKNGTVGAPPPERWTRRLLDDLAAIIGPSRMIDRLSPQRSAEVLRLQPIERRLALRDALWNEMIPDRFRVLARGIDPVRAHELRELMEVEAVSRYQLQLIPRLERRHPTRPGARPVAPDPRAGLEREDDAFALLGHWGVLDEGRAGARAVRDRSARPHVLPWDQADDPFAAYRRALIVHERPWSGIELLCQTELENGPWAADSAEAHAVTGRRYTRRMRHVARDRRSAWDGAVPNYFEAAADSSSEPVISVTLDAQLQETLHRELGDLMVEHGPALAMGIAVDIQTGDVLALDTRSQYPYSGFAPVRHVFTPGSTFKAIIMGLALDSGVTTPNDSFPTFAGTGIRVGRRTIGEAEGAPTTAQLTAAEGLAYSCNAVLVQIAHRMEASYLRSKLVDFGYAQRPGAGLGTELPGTLPELVKGTWSKPYAHASVGFGHEVGVTLWQHAGALATLLRGGVSRPLRLLRSMERDGDYREHDIDPGVRVLSEDACESVRQMMAIGANIGTGRHIARADMHPEFEWIGTKTGTTEKVGTEICVHLELSALAETIRTSTAWTKEKRAKLRELPKPHRKATCYTSSICAAGRAEVNGEMREIMVLVVADDAVGEERFGSRVTGPTAIAVLRQAFGFEREAPAVSAVEASSGAVGGDALPSVGAVIVPEFRADWLSTDLPWADEPEDHLEGGQ